MTLHRSRRGRAGLIFIAIAGAVLATSLALADDASDRDNYIRDIDSRLSSAASELSGVKSDSDDGDIRDADGYIDQVRDLVSRLSGVKGDDSKARDIVDRYPGYIDKWKSASAALHSMKGYQNGNVTLAKVCQDKNTELVAQARDFENRSDPEGLEKLPRLASEAKNLTTRFLEDAERFRAQMEDWNRTVHYFDISDGKWSDVKSVAQREAEEIYGYYKSDQDNAKQQCRDLIAGVDHPVVRDVLSKLANSSAGRKEVQDNLMRLMGEMVSKIKEVPGASGTYVVDNVREKLDAIDSTLQILDRTKGADPRAKAIAETWPSISREARNAIEPLKELKEFHHALDELPGKCKEMESKLDSFISSNGDDSDGIDTIPEFATQLGNPVSAGLGLAKERLEKMSVARAKVQAFRRSEPVWSDVAAAYDSTAVTLYKYFEDKHEETLAACQYLKMTKDHPKVKAALDRLRANSGSAIDVLTREVNEWVVKARNTYRLDCDSMTKMWETYCGYDWEPDDENPGDIPEQEAAHLQGVMRAAMEPLITELAGLQKRANALAKKKDTQDRANRLIKDLDKEEERLTRLFKNSTWQGANDPLKFYAAEYGKAAHRRMESDFSCDVKDVAFVGPTRPDCIRAKDCTIFEFKSKHSAALAQGETQLASYRPMVTDYYQKYLDDKSMVLDDDHGGAKFLKALDANGCIKDNRVTFFTKLEPYEMCERRYHCVEN